MVQKDSVNTSRPCASFTTKQSSGSSCSPACFNSLIIRAANLRASSSSCRIVPSVLPYSLTLSRHVTTKWYRGKCAPLSASENSGSIILSAHEWLRNIREHIPQPTVSFRSDGIHALATKSIGQAGDKHRGGIYENG
jgi:hypothetical protein